MTATTQPVLPSTLTVERDDDVAVLRLARPGKRNALDGVTVLGIGAFFAEPPSWARAAVLDAEGDHFCAGLDLDELGSTEIAAGIEFSRMWHQAFARLERGTLPVVAVLKGAVVGGGVELASATHVRVAEPSAFYAFPEGRHGLFVGGGGSVRVPRLIGAHRMAEMMLTGRVLDADEGQELGLSHYLAASGGGLARACELARRIAGNAPLSNFAVLQALPRIAESSPDAGYLLEALMAGVACGSDDAQARIQAFLAGRAEKVGR